MTIAEAIACCDALHPNAYTQAEKIRWLSELDAQAHDEIFAAYAPHSAFTPYDADTDTAQRLSIPHPYDRLYPLYLSMQIDRCNAEIARYNNSAQLFNDAYLSFQAYWNRTHAASSATALRY